ncbi:MAG: hypothetical protein EAZ32_04690 [Cytophagia bacterium]|nr:MAG: hypothetical protein EAZ32_04690 [Cytophagia bacterium]
MIKMKIKTRLLVLLCLAKTVAIAQNPAQQYQQTQRQLAKGWNTWNTQSVLSQVLLPEGLSVNIGFKANGLTDNRYLHESYISTKQKRPEQLEAGYHAYDGSYTECTVTWEGMTAKVETAAQGPDLVVLVTPLKTPTMPPNLVIEVAMLWNRAGNVQLSGQQITAKIGEKAWKISSTSAAIADFLPLKGRYLNLKLNQQIGVSVGKVQNLEAIKALINQKRTAFEMTLNQYGANQETYLAQQSVLAWNMIYDPERQAVIAPVSRNWNSFFGGHYVLFDWDTYLSGLMAGFDNKALAYANVVEVTKTIDQWEMVPNYLSAHGLGSPDRSQPPVGSIVVSELYKKYQDKWLVELLFDRLLRWNRWWLTHRQTDGYLCWGTDNVPPDGAANTWQGAAYESGLDNSPMYDGVPFDTKTHQMALADVGLMSLYVADCKALAQLATVLNRTTEAQELTQRAATFSTKLQSLWHEEKGIFLNKRTDTGAWNERLSPTLFYPLIAQVATPQQAKRMIDAHLLNPDEFWGEWVLPSVARNDSAFKQQDYWRGRIWAPLNFLVYLGIKNYDFPQVQKQLAEKSNQLLLKNWRATKSVYENYHASGVGRLPNEALNRSDNFYHWGALLGYMYLLENVK